jgi:hypothetical protein
MTNPFAATHPARYSEDLLDVFATTLTAERERSGDALAVLDPFGGTGRLHDLAARTDAHVFRALGTRTGAARRIIRRPPQNPRS